MYTIWYSLSRTTRENVFSMTISVLDLAKEIGSSDTRFFEAKFVNHRSDFKKTRQHWKENLKDNKRCISHAKREKRTLNKHRLCSCYIHYITLWASEFTECAVITVITRGIYTCRKHASHSEVVRLCSSCASRALCRYVMAV